MGMPAGRTDDRLDVLDLALDGVRQRVAAVAPAASVEVPDGEVGGQRGGEAVVRAPIHRAAGDEDDRGPRAGDIGGEPRPVLRGDGLDRVRGHLVLLSRAARWLK